MDLSSNSFLTFDYFNDMSGLGITDSIEEDNFNSIANYVINLFELFCSRPLKSRTFSPNPLTDDIPPIANTNYDPDRTIFDGPDGIVFWFPTYPVSSIISFSVSGTAISASTDYTADAGYVLYSKTGKLIYNSGFDYGYLRNVETEFIAGYQSTDLEYEQLTYLQYSLVLDLYNTSKEGNDSFISERIGSYSYTRPSVKDMQKLSGLYPKIFYGLFYFKRIIIE